MLDRMAQNTTNTINSITVRDFLTQIDNIMAYNTRLNWRAPIRADDGGVDKLIVDVVERDRGLGAGVESLILDLIHVDYSTRRTAYSIQTLKDKIISLAAARPQYLHLPILLGYHPEVADISGLTMRDFSILGGSVPGITILEATGPR
jgi:hypothetical protein